MGPPAGRNSVSRETVVFFVTIAKNWSQIPSTGRFFGCAEYRTSEIPILVGGTDSSFDIFLDSEQDGGRRFDHLRSRRLFGNAVGNPVENIVHNFWG